MNYQPGPIPQANAGLAEYLRRELARVAACLADNAPRVAYLPGILSPPFTADNFKPQGLAGANVVRISASATQTLTGIALRKPGLELYLVNVGTGVVVLAPQNAASSASARFALAATWQLSAGAAAHLWWDPISARWRGLGRT